MYSGERPECCETSHIKHRQFAQAKNHPIPTSIAKMLGNPLQKNSGTGGSRHSDHFRNPSLSSASLGGLSLDKFPALETKVVPGFHPPSLAINFL